MLLLLKHEDSRLNEIATVVRVRELAYVMGDDKDRDTLDRLYKEFDSKSLIDLDLYPLKVAEYSISVLEEHGYTITLCNENKLGLNKVKEFFDLVDNTL